MIILKMIGLVFWLMVIPVGLGLLFRKSPKREHLPKKLQTAGVTLLIGYLLLFALLEMVGIPIIRLSWLFQNGDFVCSSADLRGRSRLWVLDIPGEEGTEKEPVRCLKGNR